jgi:hypothetical protein
MRGKDTLLTLASNPKATRVLLTLLVLGVFTLAADPAAADIPSCDEVTGPPYEEPACYL